MSSTYKNGQWIIGCKTSTDLWLPTSATTLAGAKRCATSKYQVSSDGRLQVAQAIGEGDSQQVIEMSRKHGYDNWVDAP